MIDKFISEVRLFQFLYAGVDFHDDGVKSALIKYVNKYIQHKEMSSIDLHKNYEKFLKQYSVDVRYFIENKCYPAISEDYSADISREEYDVALLLSTIMSQHRYEIMYEIYTSATDSQNALIIGSGIGLEIELVKSHYSSIDAYDIELDEFCYKNHHEVNFVETEFQSNGIEKYDDVYIIELLEHVYRPYELIKQASEVIVDGGRVIITLAVDMPQFDHVFNFNDRALFFEKLDELSLCVDYEREIKHVNLKNGLSGSSNIFMILKRIK